MFVFYDTETTGTNLEFDQILQFAAILVDERFLEVDRFNLRCRILPWVVPAPIALVVTGIAPSHLTDLALPTFYEMMSKIHARLSAWSPATFVGYNSMRFDEPLLQRALWQTLHPPYLTVTKGNARLDLLPLVQAASHLFPKTLVWPERPNGRTGFKLDEIAPANGFDHANAHDALADVEATVFLAKRLSEATPTLWTHASAHASKSSTAALLSPGDLVLIVEYFGGGPSVWFGQAIDQDGGPASSATVVRLDHDWKAISDGGAQALKKAATASPKTIRELPLNKAPLVFSDNEAGDLFGLSPTQEELDQATFLSKNPEFAKEVKSAAAEAKEPWPEGDSLEQMIFAGFPTAEDLKRMTAFHQADWPTRAKLVGSFDDGRYRQLAQRLVYLEEPGLLNSTDVSRIELAIAERLFADEQIAPPWRTLAAALQGVVEYRATEGCNDEKANSIETWLKGLRRKYNALQDSTL